jgi:gas vesicle protein
MNRDDYRDYAGDAVRWLAAGFGLGLLIGGALGILLAPKSGRETREQLREIATDFGERARTVAGDLGERASATYGTVSERAKAAATGIGERAGTIRETGARIGKAVREGYKKKVEELEGEAGEEPAES